MITAEAVGVLSVCVYQEIPPSAPALQKRFEGLRKQGRDYFLRILGELEAAGLIARPKSKIGQRIQTENYVTAEGIEYLLELGFPTPEKSTTVVGFSDPLSQHSQHITSNSLYSLNSKEYTREDPRVEDFIKIDLEVDEVAWGGMFESSATDERLEQREHAQKMRQAEYDQQKAEKRAKGVIYRRDVAPKLWTSSDVAYEFADRVAQIWGIKPWSIKESRIIPAFGNMRKQLSLNGEIELKMLDLFFSVTDFEKYNNPEMLWQMFVKRSSEFAAQAQGMIRSTEELEVAAVQANKSQEWLYE
jgi:hypothetical protein